MDQTLTVIDREVVSVELETTVTTKEILLEQVAVGFQGPRGPIGPKGEEGPMGPAGEDFPSDPLAYYILAKA